MPTYGVQKRSGIRLVGAVLAVSALAATTVGMTASPATAAPPAPEVVTTSTSGTWTVPAGVTSIDVTLIGGAGGGTDQYISAMGGRGSLVTGTLAVSPGDVFQLDVGAMGSQDRTPGQGATAGGRGGGSGYCGHSGAGGGGSTGIRPQYSSFPIMLAAGGGGGGGHTNNSRGGTGGDGDLDNAGSGTSFPGYLGNNNKSDGGAGDSSSSCAGGGGGGGGFDPSGKSGGGGGGGANFGSSGGGGGAGRSWVSPAVHNPVLGAHGEAGENGSVTISYVLPYTTTQVQPSSRLTALHGAPISVDAAVESSDGRIPTGSVSLVATGATTALATGVLDPTGRASLTFVPTAAGVMTARLEFVSDAGGFPSSSSADITLTITPALGSIGPPAVPGLGSPAPSVPTPSPTPGPAAAAVALAASGADDHGAAILGAAATLVGLVLLLTSLRRRRDPQGSGRRGRWFRNSRAAP